MTKLNELKGKTNLFLGEIAQLPEGRYVHFVMIRQTESFPVFQTDGTLNVIRVRAGLKDENVISRLVMFKRKQSSPERLNGRELLRSVGVISSDEKAANYCEYNSEAFCKKCPDCIHYGYAIGDQGAEKSKVLTDSAFSITPYEASHKAFSFNALYEHGTMTDEGKTRSSFGEQDHIMPQVFFPAVETLRDPTYEGFLYILGNLLRTDRYGAQETRTGKVQNRLVAICFANGEIFSNLAFTQAIHDALAGEETMPLDPAKAYTAAGQAYQTLMSAEPVSRALDLTGESLAELLADVTALYQDEKQTKDVLSALDAKTHKYAENIGTPQKKSKGKKSEE